MSTALQICAAAFRQAQMDQDLASFSTTQEYPYNIALDLLNNVIREMNRRGNFWFTETKTALSYSPGVNTYSFTGLSVDPKRVIKIRRDAATSPDDLTEVSASYFRRHFPTISAGQPTRWAKFGSTLYLNTIPDQDYSLNIYHYDDIPIVTNTGDTLPIPVADEDVLQDGIYAYLGQRLGRPDFQTAYQLFQDKIAKMLVEVKSDAGMPAQLPAMF